MSHPPFTVYPWWDLRNSVSHILIQTRVDLYSEAQVSGTDYNVSLDLTPSFSKVL